MKKLLSIILMASMIVTLTPIACGGALTQNVAYADSGNTGSGDGSSTSTPVTPTVTWIALAQSNLNDASYISNLNDTNAKTLQLVDGNYQLSSDITISKTLEITGTVTLDLNGYVLKYENASVEGSVIKVASSGNLTIMDSRANDNSAAHKFKVDATQNNLWVLVDNSASETGVEYKTVTGGVITGGKASDGGGIFVSNNATFKLQSGNIVGCIAEKCGGVFLDLKGVFIMQGGSIKGCLSIRFDDNNELNDGGGVYLEVQSSFVMENGCIEECKGRNGGGVYIREYSGTMTSGSGNFTMNGGQISNCTSSDGGDDVYANGKFTMSGGKIISALSGSLSLISTDIYNSNVNITGGEIIDNRTQTNVYAINGKADISGGTITGNCYLYKYSTISGGTLNGNVEGKSDITGGTFSKTISGGTFYSDDDNFYEAITLQGLGEVNENIYVVYKVDEKNYAKQIIGSYTSWSPKSLSSKPGYNFDGWYTDSSESCNDNEKYNGKYPVNTSETITLYYNWIEKSYRVNFDYNDGTSQIKTSNVKWTGEVISNITEPTREGYNFKGWVYENSAVSTNTKYKDLVPNDDAKNNTITLTAQWEKIGTHYGGSSRQHPTVAETTNGTITLSSNGRTATITPDDGYEIASVTVNGEEKGTVTTLTGLRTGNKIAATFQKTKATLDAETKAAVASLSTLKARSSKTAQGNIKVVAKLSTAEKAKLAALADLGYTVKYKFYRSTKKSSSYKGMLEKSSPTYINTYGKADTRYYYKCRVMVYDANGTLVANAALKNCKYATRIR